MPRRLARSAEETTGSAIPNNAWRLCPMPSLEILPRKHTRWDKKKVFFLGCKKLSLPRGKCNLRLAQRPGWCATSTTLSVLLRPGPGPGLVLVLSPCRTSPSRAAATARQARQDGSSGRRAAWKWRPSGAGRESAGATETAGRARIGQDSKVPEAFDGKRRIAKKRRASTNTYIKMEENHKIQYLEF